MFRRILQRFLKPTSFVGRDLEGNKYYEYSNGDGRPKRTVQYKRTDDMWTYIASGKRLPEIGMLKLRAVQWNAWLTHTRPNPPSIEELQADLTRQHRVQMNAAILEARDREEREPMVRLAQPSCSQVPGPRSENERKQERNGPPVDSARPDSGPSHVRDPWTEVKRGSDEPQSWIPVVRRK